MKNFTSLEDLGVLKNRPEEPPKKSLVDKVANYDKQLLEKKEIENKKDLNKPRISSIKIGEWENIGSIGGEWESSDGRMAGNDARQVFFLTAGLEIDVSNIFPDEKEHRNFLCVESFNPEDIITNFKNQIDDQNRYLAKECRISPEKIDIILEEIKEKLPKFKKVDNPYIIKSTVLEKSIDNPYIVENGIVQSEVLKKSFEDNDAIDKKLMGIPYGLVLIKYQDNKEKSRHLRVAKSSLEKTISLEDARKRNIPVEQYNGALYVHFPDNQKRFDKLKSEKIKSFEETEERFFDADVILRRVESTGWGKRKKAYYTIKNVLMPAAKYEIIDDLIDGSVEEKYLEETTTFEDKSTSKELQEDETAPPSGHYRIKLSIPKNGQYRGQRIYSIITDDQYAREKEILQDNLEQEKNDSYQQELAKTATLMKGLVGSHKDQKGLPLHAVKEDDGLWHAYVGEPFHLRPLKGFKSLSTAKTSSDLIKIFKEAGY